VTAPRKGVPPGPERFTWRGIRFSPPDRTEPRGFYKSTPIELADDRTAEWKVQCLEPHAWHARLRIGGDRFPGVGATPAAALEAALVEAANTATYIVAMMPSQGVDVSLEPLRTKRTPATRSKRKPQAIPVRR
jgi:hypothetical protein